jgi:hypothetical protein
MSLLGRQRPLVAWTQWEQQMARNFEYRQLHKEIKKPRVEPYSPPRSKMSWKDLAWNFAGFFGFIVFSWLALALVVAVLRFDDRMALWPFGG